MTGSGGRVVVIGGGLAGITAALNLAEGGVPVVLLEARPWLGGATWSFGRRGLTIDNGQHVFLRCFTAYRELLARLGAAESTRLQDRLDVTVLAPEGSVRLRRGSWPAPTHLAMTVARYRPLTASQRVAVLPAAMTMWLSDLTGPESNGASIGDWLSRHGQDEQAITRFWELFLLPFMNAPAARTDQGTAAAFINAALLSHRDQADLGIAAVPLRELHAGPAGRRLAQLGAEVRLGVQVTAVRRGERGGFVVQLDPGAPAAGEVPGQLALGEDAELEIRTAGVVLAVPAWTAASLLADELPADVAAWSRLRPAPVVSVHAIYDRPIMEQPFVATVGSPLRWIADKTQAAGLHTGQYLAASVLAAGSLVDEPSAAIRAQLLPELARLFPAAAGARVEDFFVTRERSATFRPAPGSRGVRPRQLTRLAGLALAGAWTATGWPDTMEGAVRSGHLAAEAILTARAGTVRARARAQVTGAGRPAHGPDRAPDAVEPLPAAAVSAGPAQPGPAVAATAAPVVAESVVPEPVDLEPVAAEPVDLEPVAAEPVAVESVPADAASAIPAATDDAPALAVPAQHGSAEARAGGTDVRGLAAAVDEAADDETGHDETGYDETGKDDSAPEATPMVRARSAATLPQERPRAAATAGSPPADRDATVGPTEPGPAAEPPAEEAAIAVEVTVAVEEVTVAVEVAMADQVPAGPDAAAGLEDAALEIAAAAADAAAAQTEAAPATETAGPVSRAVARRLAMVARATKPATAQDREVTGQTAPPAAAGQTVAAESGRADQSGTAARSGSAAQPLAAAGKAAVTTAARPASGAVGTAATAGPEPATDTEAAAAFGAVRDVQTAGGRRSADDGGAPDGSAATGEREAVAGEKSADGPVAADGTAATGKREAVAGQKTASRPVATDESDAIDDGGAADDTEPAGQDVAGAGIAGAGAAAAATTDPGPADSGMPERPGEAAASRPLAAVPGTGTSGSDRPPASVPAQRSKRKARRQARMANKADDAGVVTERSQSAARS